MARSFGYGGGRDYGYPDSGGFGSRTRPSFEVAELGLPDDTLGSITELAKMVRERRDKEEKAAREAQAEFRRVTVDVPEGFVVQGSQRVGGMDTPEKKVAAAWEGQRLWNEEKERQKHAAEQSRLIAQSTKDAEKAADEIRQEGQKRRADLMKLEVDRQHGLAKYEQAKKSYGVRQGKARARDEMAAAKLGEVYNPAMHSTFDEDAPEMPTRAVMVYDKDWNIVGSQELPLTDPRNFIRAAGGQETIFPTMSEQAPTGQPRGQQPSHPLASPQARREGNAPTQDEQEFQTWYRDRAGKLGLNPNPDAPEHFYDYRAAHAAGAEPDATGHWPSQFKREGHPNLIVGGVDTRTGKPAGPRSLVDITREAALAKKQKEADALEATELAKYNKAVNGAIGALHKQRQSYAKGDVGVETPEQAIASAWDWSLGMPPSPEDLDSGRVTYRLPKGQQRPAAAPQMTEEQKKAEVEKRWAEGVEIGAQREQAAGRNPEAYRIRMDTAKFGSQDVANIRSQARRLAQMQGEPAAEAFLQRMQQLYTRKEPSLAAQAGAWTLRIGLPLAAGAGVGLVSGGTLALPAGGAAGLLGEHLARKLTGEPEMTPGEVGITTALGMLPGGTGAKATTATTGAAIKRAALEAAAVGGITGGIGSATLPAVGENPELPTAGGIATGVGTGAALGGVLGGTIAAAAAKWFGPKVGAAVAQAAQGDEQVQSLAQRLEATPPEGRAQILEMLRARMHVLASQMGPAARPGAVNFDIIPRQGEPEFIGPHTPTIEQMAAGQRSQAPDLLAMLTEQAGNVPSSGRFVGPLPEWQPGDEQFVGPVPPEVGSATQDALATLQPGLRNASEALIDPEALAAAAKAAKDEQLAALVAKKPWRRANRGESAVEIGEPVQGPLLPGQDRGSLIRGSNTTPAGIQLPEGVEPPSPRAVERAGQSRAPGSPEAFQLWLAEKGIPAKQWDAMLQSPDAAAQVDQLISAYNAEIKRPPAPPSFNEFLQTKGIAPRDWDFMLQSETPETIAQVDAVIREYNEMAGFADEGGPNPALENAPTSPEPVPARGSELGMSDMVSDQIQQLQEEAQAILEKRQSIGTEPPSREFPEGRAGGGRKVVRGQSPEQIKADTDRLNEINDTINMLVERARKGREVTPPREEVPTVAANAEIARAQAAIAAAEQALQKGGVTTQRRFENRAMRGEGEGKGAQPFKEVGFEISGQNRLSSTPQEVPRAQFDVALEEAERAVAGVRAAREATKNVPETANAIRAAAVELEKRLTALKRAKGGGRAEQRPIAAIKDTAEALSLTREGLAKNPQDRNLATRARMLEERLSDLVGRGQQNRYRATRAQDGKFYVMRDATPAGTPYEGKVPRGREKAIAGPFKDIEQAGQFAAELEARWADIQQLREGDWPRFIKQPTLPKGAPPVKGKSKPGTQPTRATQANFPDERSLERGEMLAIKELQEEWASIGRPIEGGRWEFRPTPERGLGKSKSVAAGRVPKRLRDEFTRTGRMSKIDRATAALKLSPAQRAALNKEPTSPFESAPSARVGGGGASAEFLGLGTVYNKAKAALTSRFAKAAVRGPRSTLKTLHEDFAGGDSVVEDFLNYQDRHQELAGRWKNEIQQALDLLKTDSQRKDFVQALEDKSLIPAADPDVQLAVMTARAALDDVAAHAGNAQRFSQYLDDYFPHYALQEPTFRTQAELLARKLWNSDLHRTRMQQAGATGATDTEAINYAASQLIQPRSSGIDAKNVHLEKARSSTVAMRYRTDPEVLLQYMDAAARSVAQGEHFDRPIAAGAPHPATGAVPMGNQRLGKLRQDLADLRMMNPGKETRIDDIETTLLRELGFHEGKRPGVIGRTVSDVRDVIASQKLMLSPITQMGSLADTAAVFGYSGAAKALKAMGSDVAERNATRAGSVSARSEQAARETAMQIRGAGGTQGKSPITNLVRGHKWFGPDAVWMDAMVAVDRKQRIGADAAARASLPDLIAELRGGNAATERLLAGANVSGKLLGEIKALSPQLVKRHLAGQSVPRDTERVIDAYARRMTDFTQQRPSPSNLPPSWSTEGGRWLTMFMPFGLRQTQNMLTALRNNPKTFLAAGVPAYLLMGGIVNLMKGFASGYGMIGENDDNRTVADKIQQALSNRPVGVSEGLDAPEDLALRAAQAYLQAGPKPFALTVGEKAERGLESSGEATRALIGAGGSAVDAPVALVRGMSGLGQPEDQSRAEYALRGAASAAGHVLLPSTFAYQLQRELMPPETSLSKKFRPSHKPGWIGRVADIPAEAKRIGALEAAKNAFLGGTFGTDEYLSATRSKRKADVAADKKKKKQQEERAQRKKQRGAPPPAAFNLSGGA